MNIDKEGWCQEAKRLVSPNQNERPLNQTIDLLVIHNISLPPGEFGGHCIVDLFLNRLDCNRHPFFEQLRSLKVSSHFLIDRDGALIQFVSTEKRAWHAGVSSYRGRTGCNDFSIGIEIEGTDYEPFMAAQYDTLVLLTEALCQRYPLQAVTGHQHIAPERKTDPGPFFNWARYQEKLEKTGGLISRTVPFEFWIT
nr:1,6-anhydro-N-acetylmuramyl-L-alanine amidase AmpD [Oxalobacter paraformigenes]